MIVSLLIGGAGIWFVARDVALEPLVTALRTAAWSRVALAIVVATSTIFLKACRWYLMFRPPLPPIPFKNIWWTLCIGVFFNLLLPIARLGEIGRIYLLSKHVRKAQVLGTLVIEKSIEMVMLAVTLLIALSLTILPDVISQPLVFITITAALFTFLYLVAYQSEQILRLIHWCSSWLPERLGRFITTLATDSLTGLSALRGRQTTFQIFLLSTLSTATSILTPYLLFQAFNLPLGIAEATLINAVVAIGSVPSSAPGNIGVLQFIIIATLQQLGIGDETVMLGYALVYHATTHLPPIILGPLGLSRTDWRPWHTPPLPE